MVIFFISPHVTIYILLIFVKRMHKFSVLYFMLKIVCKFEILFDINSTLSIITFKVYEFGWEKCTQV